MPDTTGNEHPAKAARGGDQPLLEWSVRLARDRGHTAVAVGAIAVAGAMGWAAFHSVAMAGAAALVVFSSAAEFLLPIRYRLTAARAVAMAGLGRQEIPWSSVRRVEVSDAGVLLSPLAHPGRLDAFRGVFLRFQDDATRSAAIAIAEARAPGAVPHA